MASGHVNRTNRPNTWLQPTQGCYVKISLPTRSRPHMAQSGHADTLNRCPLWRLIAGEAASLYSAGIQIGEPQMNWGS